MKRGSRSALAAACALLAALAWGTAAASAEIIHGANGHFLGITLHRGVAPASVPGSTVPRQQANSSNGNLNYHGGPVVHSSAAYLVFWTPTGFSIPASSRALIQRYFSDAAAGSGTSGTTFAVDRQFTDGAGFADYQQAFNPATQVITDQASYPGLNPGQCATPPPGSICVSDAQIEAELQRLISTGLPDDGHPSSSLPANAPIYFVVLPSNVNVCDGSGICADNVFCGYHSSFTDSSHHEVLYATIPFLPAAQNPKQCQSDRNAVVQEPNGDLADVVLKYLSHEHSEVLTDPLGSAWYNSSSLNEGGDNCNATGAANPQGGQSPNAFLPVLGGSALAGTLFDQVMAGHPYYVQSEWSNGDAACQMAPSAGAINPQFTVPGASTQGSPASFDPSASTSTNPLSSATWDFGDGTAPTFSTSSSIGTVAHVYSAAGTYTVKLTLVDDRGNLATTTRQITVDEAPIAAFSIGIAHAAVGQPVSFDATSSGDPDGSIMSYSWSFGDGTSGTGATPTHSYGASGVYMITLKVTDSIGATATITQQLPVGLIASFTVTSPPPLLQGQPVSFDGTHSLPSPGATITSYSWDFGDGSAPVTGASTSHAYLHYGSYVVRLTVTDSSHATATAAQTVVVHEHPPSASFTVLTAVRVAGQPVAFDGSSSSDPDGPIVSYTWTFGDGSTATGVSPSHVYMSYGTYSVTLTVADGDGQTATTTQRIVVYALPAATLAVLTSSPTTGQTVAFDGSGSSDPDASIVSYAWTFGDGGTGVGPHPTHTYSGYGNYTVTLTVTDANGLSGSVSRQVAVHAQSIAAFSFSPSRPFAGTTVRFDASSSRNPEPGVSIGSYAWSFGDGGAATGNRPTHAYRKPGSYRVTLTVTSSLGASARAVEVVRVIAAGRITRLALQSMRSGATLFISVSGAGVLSAGRKSIRLRHPATVRLQINLSASQVRRLAAHSALTIHLALSFAPRIGPPSRKRLTIVFRASRASSHRVYAGIQR